MLHHVTVGEGEPLLILHGSRLDHRYMMATVEPLFETLDGWQRVYVDLPGHGLSPGRDDISTQDDLLAAVVAFAEATFADRRYGIIGESRGSYLAQGFAHLYPDRLTGVALIVPGGNPTSDPARLPPHQVMEPDPALRSELPDSELKRFDQMMVVQTREIVEKVQSYKIPAMALWDPVQEGRVGKEFDFAHDRRGETSVFEGPSVIIAGRQDWMSGYLDAMDLMPLFPRATLAVLDCAGHGLAWERPDLFNALMWDWLNRLRRAAG